MKVTTSQLEGSQVVLEMEIEPERVDKAMDRAYRRVVSRVNVPGFRKGKAPRFVVERLVGRETLMNEALEILVPEAYKEAVQEAGIDPVDDPKLDVVSAEPLSVRATVPVRPAVGLGDYRSIRQSVEVPVTTDEQVQSSLESLRQAHGQWTPVEREAQAEDMVTLELKARTSDNTFVDTKDAHVVLQPDQPILAPGVVEQLIGMKSGDRKAFDITLPADFSEKEVAGKDAVIEAGISEIKEKRVPALDEELAKTVGDFKSVEELTVAVRKELEEQARHQAHHNLEDSVLSAVVDQSTAEPPTPWVGEQAEVLLKNTIDSMGREGLTLEQFLQLSNRTEESFREELTTRARRQLKQSLVLDAIAKAEGIAVEDAEVETALQQAIAERGKKVEPADMQRLRTNLRSALRERKTVARLLEIAEGRVENGAEAAAEGDAEGHPTAEQSEAGEEK